MGMTLEQHLMFMKEAIAEAKRGLSEGGIPIGAVLVMDGKIVGRGCNQRVQQDSPILHAEMEALNNAGRLSAKEYKQCVLYSTLSPCSMCSGAVRLYKIPTVVVGENENFMGDEEVLKSDGVEVINLNNDVCIDMMAKFIDERPYLWYEDIGI